MKYFPFLVLALLAGCSTPPAPSSVLSDAHSEEVYTDLTGALKALYPVGRTHFFIAYQNSQSPTNLEAGLGAHLRLAGYACQDSTEPLGESGEEQGALIRVPLSLTQVHGEDRDMVTAHLGESRKLILAYDSGRAGKPELIGITQELSDNEES